MLKFKLNLYLIKIMNYNESHNIIRISVYTITFLYPQEFSKLKLYKHITQLQRI